MNHIYALKFADMKFCHQAAVGKSGILTNMELPYQIRPCHIMDLPALYRICLRTGYQGKDATEIYSDPDLLGHIYVGPYMALIQGHIIGLYQGARLLGYCCFTTNTRELYTAAEKEWWPPLRIRYQQQYQTLFSSSNANNRSRLTSLPTQEDGKLTPNQASTVFPSTDLSTRQLQILLNILYQPPLIEEELLAEYPAHLHLNILPEAQGRGQGKALLKAALNQIAAHTTGVHLEVDSANHNARKFYEKHGFQQLQRREAGQLLVHQIQHLA